MTITHSCFRAPLVASILAGVAAILSAAEPMLDPATDDLAIHDIAVGDAEGLSLWYDRPAEKWTEALPIGNGRLGGMVFGGITNERIQLNEDTF
jgi:alpha-L-fucosidase 2